MKDWTRAFAASPRYINAVANIIDDYPETELEWDEDGDGVEYISRVYWQGDVVYDYECNEPGEARDNFPHGLVKRLDQWAGNHKLKTNVGEATKLPLP